MGAHVRNKVVSHAVRFNNDSEELEDTPSLVDKEGSFYESFSKKEKRDDGSTIVPNYRKETRMCVLRVVKNKDENVKGVVVHRSGSNSQRKGQHGNAKGHDLWVPEHGVGCVKFMQPTKWVSV